MNPYLLWSFHWWLKEKYFQPHDKKRVTLPASDIMLFISIFSSGRDVDGDAVSSKKYSLSPPTSNRTQ